VRASGRVVTSVDVGRIEQVVTNLLDNAIRYCPGGPIEVDLSRPDADLVRVSVTDHGDGVPAEHREHLFERFHQGHTSTYRSGLGLGLYISKQLVELHGGHLEHESPADGGARFVMTLPRDAATAPATPRPA
jgi:signal transduction histidine kinase